MVDPLANTHCSSSQYDYVIVGSGFGGVGPSGVGQYHGKEGFETFSNLKGVVSKGRINSTAFVGAPWDRPIFRSLTAMQWLRFRRRPS